MVEGLPNVLIEAQGNSVPVISTDAGGSSETFVSGISGFTVDDSASTIADHILRIAEDNEWIGVARETAKRSAIEKFGLEAMISNVSNLYSGGE
jgi:glycosyltransferase involved in cell wall biosynthesis